MNSSPNFRLLRGDADVAEERQVHAPADGRPVDRRDHRLVALQHGDGRGGWPGSHVAQPGGRVVPLLAEHDLAHVVAGAECTAGAGEDDAADVGIAVGLTEGLLELRVHLAVERVHDLGAIERDGQDVAVKVVTNVFVHV